MSNPGDETLGVGQIGFAGQSIPELDKAVFVTEQTSDQVTVSDSPRELKFLWRSKDGVLIEKIYKFVPDSYVIGLDVTPEMVERATKNAGRAGVEEIVEFRLGEMEDMPIDDESVDLIISNCVVNLSPDKEKVFQEAYRVLKPGGRMLISDIVASGFPEEIKNDLSSWAGCVAGALEESEYLRVIGDAGFEDIAVVDRADATDLLLGAECCGTPAERPNTPRISSIQVKAAKAIH